MTFLTSRFHLNHSGPAFMVVENSQLELYPIKRCENLTGNMYRDIHVQCINPPELQFGSFITMQNGFRFVDNPRWIPTDSATQNGCFNKDNFQRICYFQLSESFDKIHAENFLSAKLILNARYQSLKMMSVTIWMMRTHNYSKLTIFILEIFWSE